MMFKIIFKRQFLKKASSFTKYACERCKYTNSESEMYSKEKRTHFGYEDVSESDKAERVYSVFKSVADNYDIMNDAMSLGIHRCWKDTFVNTLRPNSGIKHLDMAGGTGDIAFRIVKRLNDEKYSKYGSEENEDSKSRIVICDINSNMLKVGQERAKSLGFTNDLEFVCADAEKLPFEDGSFDAYTIAFGIRNVIHVDKALEEAYRVLRVGGRFLCLEFSEVHNPLARWFYDHYSFQVIPALGQILSRDWKAYLYLVESIRKFPNQENFKEMIENVGFSLVDYTNLTIGVTAIHSGFKL